MTRLPAILCAVVLSAGPAFAQTASEADSSGDAVQPGEPAVTGIAEPGMAASQDRVISVLTSAGYTDVRIVDTTYAVKATTPEGETVTIVVDLATMPGIADAPEADGAEDPASPASVDPTRFGAPEGAGEAEPSAD